MRTIHNLLSSSGGRDSRKEAGKGVLRGRACLRGAVSTGRGGEEETGRSVAAFPMQAGRAGTRPWCGNSVPAPALTAGGMLLQARE